MTPEGIGAKANYVSSESTCAAIGQSFVVAHVQITI